jgi:hypothetical protein
MSDTTTATLQVGDVVDYEGLEFVVWLADETKACITSLKSKILTRTKDGEIQFLAKGNTENVAPDSDMKVLRSLGREGLAEYLLQAEEIKKDKRSKKKPSTDLAKLELNDDQSDMDLFLDVEDGPKREGMVELAAMAQAAITGMTEAATRYLQLVRYVRECDLEDDDVRRVLKSRGYNDARCSEIHRVAHGSEAVLQEYEDRVIGFKQAVEKNRQLSNGKPDSGKFKLKFERLTNGLVKYIADGKGLSKLGVDHPCEDEYILNQDDWIITFRRKPVRDDLKSEPDPKAKKKSKKK